MARLRIGLSGLIGAALATAPLSIAAQAPAQVKLRSADAKLDHEFTRIGTVRELKDGRVLVTDRGEKQLSVVDFRAGTVETVGRRGAGPSEYSDPNRLFQLAGDSAILDAGSRRWLILVGAKIVATIPADNPGVVAARGLTAGADYSGRIVSSHFAGKAFGGPATLVDSQYLVIVNRSNGHVDTVGRLRSPQTVVSGTIRGADGKVVPLQMGGPYYDATDQAVMFSDGWIAVARLSPYRVEWLPPKGRWLPGSPLAEAVPLDAREKQAYVERSARRAGRPPRSSPGQIGPWPSTIPEFFGFDPGVLLTGPAGRLVVRRSPTAEHEETRYDFIDRTGTRSLQLAMPETERVVGFGVKSVYVAWRDNDNIERLRRHPWP